MANGAWTEWTTEKQEELLREVVGAGGNVTEAAKIVNIARQTIYNHKKSDPGFAKLLDAAVLAGVDVLEDEARRRAFAGWDEPVFYKGDKCGSVHKYSDTLLIFMLKAARPDVYRERASWELSGPGGAPLATPGVIIHLPDNGRGIPNTE